MVAASMLLISNIDVRTSKLLCKHSQVPGILAEQELSLRHQEPDRVILEEGGWPISHCILYILKYPWSRSGLAHIVLTLPAILLGDSPVT